MKESAKEEERTKKRKDSLTHINVSRDIPETKERTVKSVIREKFVKNLENV